MHTNERTQSGSALLEAILGIALLALLLVILAGSITYVEQGTQRATRHEQLLFFAAEGQEAVRSMRDANFATLTDGAHGLTHVNGIWEFAGDHDADGAMTRRITILHETASTTKVGVNVSWENDQGSAVLLETYLTDWHEAQ